MQNPSDNNPIPPVLPPPPPPTTSDLKQKPPKSHWTVNLPSSSQAVKCDMNDYNEELIVVDPNIHDSSECRHNYSDIKVLVLQQHSKSSFADADMMERAILQSMASDNRKPDFVLLPECFVSSSSMQVNLSTNKTLSALAQVIQKYHIYGVLGTMRERDSHKYYTTSVFINRDGSILGKYRKRHPLNHLDGKGECVGVYETVFGRVALMICFDIENKSSLYDTLQYDPIMILNPTFISARGSSTGSDVTAVWNVAMTSMTRSFEHQCIEKQVTVIRCDAPEYSSGLGTSQCISPSRTIYAPSHRSASIVFFVDKPDTTKNSGVEAATRKYQNDYSELTKPPLYVRTEDADNVGNRYRVHTFASTEALRDSDVIQFYDSKHLITTHQRRLQLHQLLHRKLVYSSEPLESDIVAICTCARSKKVIISVEKSLQVWQLSSNTKSLELLQVLQLDQTIRHIAAYGAEIGRFVCVNELGEVQLFTAETCEFETRVTIDGIAGITTIDQHTFVFDSCNSQVKVYDVEFNLEACLEHSSNIIAQYLAATRDSLITLDKDGKMTSWKIGSWERQYETSGDSTVSELAALNGRFCVAATRSSLGLVLYDLSSGTAVHRFHPPVASLSSKGLIKLAFDGGSNIVTATDNTAGQNLTLYEFISNQMPTKFAEIFDA